MQTAPGTEEVLGKLFSEVTVVSLDAGAIHAFVRSHPEHSAFTLDLGEGHRYGIDLHEHDLRSPDYLAQETGPMGLVTLERTPCVTYAGYLHGAAGTSVRLNIQAHRIWGHLRSKAGVVHLEPLQNIIPDAPQEVHVLYQGKDIIAESPGECGATAEPQGPDPLKGGVAGQVKMTGDDCRKLDIATESDWEFYSGGETFADIQGNLNLVEDIYYSYFNTAFKIRYQHQWTTSADPYSNNNSGCSDPGELQEFEAHWRNNFAHIRRDISVLYTEKDYAGSTVGCANVSTFGNGITNNGTVQNSGAYSVNMWLDDVIHVQAHRTQLIAHEMGHNFGATHDDSNCGFFESGNIMCSGGLWVNLDFLPQAVAQIEADMNHTTGNAEHDGRRAMRERHAPANALGSFEMSVPSSFGGNVLIMDGPCAFSNTTAGQFTFPATETVKLLPGFSTAAQTGQSVLMFASSTCQLFNP